MGDPLGDGVMTGASRGSEPSHPANRDRSSGAPAVSVVMAVYNGERFLVEAVESILRQSWHDFEFLIVDDGSTDSTPLLLSDFQRKDARVRVHRQANQGFIAALNTGCSMAEAAFIARMDPDDVALPGRLEVQMAYLASHPEVDVLAGAFTRVSEDLRPIKTTGSPLRDEEIKAELLSFNCISHPTVVMRASALHEVGGYRPAFRDAEDYDLWLRMAERFTFASVPDIVLLYRTHGEQVSMARLRDQTLSVFAAQESARRRRGGLPDPFEHLERITPHDLAAAGVDLVAVDDSLSVRYARAARVMSEAGSYEGAIAAFSGALPGVVRPITIAEQLARLHRIEAARRLRGGDLLGAIGPAARLLAERIGRLATRQSGRGGNGGPQAARPRPGPK